LAKTLAILQKEPIPLLPTTLQELTIRHCSEQPRKFVAKELCRVAYANRHLKISIKKGPRTDPIMTLLFNDGKKKTISLVDKNPDQIMEGLMQAAASDSPSSTAPS